MDPEKETVVENQDEQIESLDDTQVEEAEQIPAEDEKEEIQDEPETDEDGDLIITIGDEETPPQEDKEAPEWVKDLRKQQRETAKENKRLKKLLEEKQEKNKVVELGQKPTLESCDYDEDVFEQELTAYYERKKQIEQLEQSKEAEAKKQEEAYQETINIYTEQRDKLKVKDFDEAEDSIKEELSEIQQGVLLASAINPALVVYAIGKNQAKLKELSKIQDPIKFAAEIARMETTMKTSRAKQAPKPETKVNGGGGGGASNDIQLDKLRKEAQRTGDFTKVTEYKRKLRNKG